MVRISIALWTLLALSFSAVFSQSNADSIDLREFWAESVQPLIQKDEAKLKEIIEFPLKGQWGYMMGVKKEEKDWTQADFFENYDKLFDNRIIELLKGLDYLNAQIVKSEILVGIGWEEEGFESAIIFRYKRIDGQWKLYVIQRVG